MAEADAAAAEMDRGLAQLGRGDAPAQHAPAAQAGGHGQAGWAQQGQHSVAEVAGGGEHQAPPGIPSASVAERPNPGTGEWRGGMGVQGRPRPPAEVGWGGGAHSTPSTDPPLQSVAHLRPLPPAPPKPQAAAGWARGVAPLRWSTLRPKLS